jgi:hypothetical protein
MGAAGAGLAALAFTSGLIPVLGPITAAGTLAAALLGAASGAAAGGLVGALIGLGLSEEDAKYYEDEVRKGRTLVTVDAGARSDDAWGILRHHGGYNRETAAEPGGADAGRGESA